MKVKTQERESRRKREGAVQFQVAREIQSTEDLV